MTRRAYMYGIGEKLPPRYPWEVFPQRIEEIKVHGDEAGTISLVTTGDTYIIPYDREIKMPMRADGSVRDWGTEVPRTDQVCIGDRVVAKGRKWLVESMYKMPNTAPTNIGVEVFDPLTAERMHCVAYANQPFVPGALPLRRGNRGESEVVRSTHPVRGPYQLRSNTDVVYYFYVHPTGRGRWHGDVDRFAIEKTPGEYYTRPISKHGRGSRDLWRMVEFIGEGDALRHPNDPEYRP